jgi:hypothetical protein
MIDYLRTYYPEDFNDYIESSEYIALIELIAFISQAISFRSDLNARENFLETAERRDSVFKLAKMLSYTPKRHINAKGLLKVTSIRTSEDVFDSTGENLSGLDIIWNDRTNPDYMEQFVAILDAAFQSTQRFGKPLIKQTLLGTRTEVYSLNTFTSGLNVRPFTTVIDGQVSQFEVVNGTTAGKEYIYETSPGSTSGFNILYQNDGKGAASVNSGFFFYFKQGVLNSSEFVVDEKLPNRVINVNVPNINNDDVWVYSVNTDGTLGDEWTKVPAVVGNNIAYNSLSKDQRKLFSVNSLANDQIQLVFGDGVFSDMPSGSYRLYYRTSNGLSYKIKPNNMQGIEVQIGYLSRNNRRETLTVTLGLQYTVNNAATRESLADIKTKAPQQYYTQNRMITGEDYNIFPFTQYRNIIKCRAVNRSSSGVSRYLDIKDVTGKYSSTNIFSTDGIFYKDSITDTFTFEWVNLNDISKVVRGPVLRAVSTKEMAHFYYDAIGRVSMELTPTKWYVSSISTNTSTGYFTNISGDNIPQGVGSYVGNNRKYIKPGTLIKFKAPTGYYFDKNNTMSIGTPILPGDRTAIWTSVKSVLADGTNQGLGELQDGTGPVVLNDKIPHGSIVDEVIPPFNTTMLSIADDIVNSVQLYKDFGVRFDVQTQTWKIISEENLDSSLSFSTSRAGDTSGSNQDNSWLILFKTDGEVYTVTYRGTSYVFESKEETQFHYEESSRIYDSRTGKVVNDAITILGINTIPGLSNPIGVDHMMFISGPIIEEDGYVNSRRVKLTFPDSDFDGVIDNPDIFDSIVGDDMYVFFKKTYNGYNSVEPVTGNVYTNYETISQLLANINLFAPGSLFYLTSDNEFYTLRLSGDKLVVNKETDYVVKQGRAELKFHYRHNAPNDRRIDPSPTNLIDLYVLTRQYEDSYRRYITDSTGRSTEPALPTVQELKNEFAGLADKKATSDTIIFNPAKFKPLFGSTASSELRASFKVVKNERALVSDSEVKSKLIDAINEYFSITNWDFGDTFYFSELSAYLHTKLSSIVSSIMLVPLSGQLRFGSLYEIKSRPDEIFVSTATVDNIEVIDSITASKIRAIEIDVNNV